MLVGSKGGWGEWTLCTLSGQTFLLSKVAIIYNWEKSYHIYSDDSTCPHIAEEQWPFLILWTISSHSVYFWCGKWRLITGQWNNHNNYDSVLTRMTRYLFLLDCLLYIVSGHSICYYCTMWRLTWMTGEKDYHISHDMDTTSSKYSQRFTFSTICQNRIK